MNEKQKKIAIIVPVSPSEGSQTILKSIEWIKALEYGNLKVRIVYAIDINSENDERIALLKQNAIGVEIFLRQSRGWRGGAINDALLYLADFKPDYVSLFDIDSRPEVNFVKECVDALESNPMEYIASSPRYVSNSQNLVSRVIEVEYHLVNLLLGISPYKLFNGLIGVLRADLLYKYHLNEDVIIEDSDYATRMHAKGYKAILVRTTRLYEQSPLSWTDLINQRKRWYYGGLQLWRYWNTVKSSNNKSVILSWLMAMIPPYAILFFLPFAIFSPFILYPEKISSKMLLLLVSAGLVLYLFIHQYSAIIALFNFASGRGIEWRPMKRVED